MNYYSLKYLDTKEIQIDNFYLELQQINSGYFDLRKPRALTTESQSLKEQTTQRYQQILTELEKIMR